MDIDVFHHRATLLRSFYKGWYHGVKQKAPTLKVHHVNDTWVVYGDEERWVHREDAKGALTRLDGVPSLVQGLFLADTTNFAGLLEVYTHYYGELDYDDEMGLVTEKGHQILSVIPWPWDLHFCTLACYDNLIGYYWIHTDDGHCRVNQSPNWGSIVDPTVDPTVDLLNVEDLRQVWGKN